VSRLQWFDDYDCGCKTNNTLSITGTDYGQPTDLELHGGVAVQSVTMLPLIVDARIGKTR